MDHSKSTKSDVFPYKCTHPTFVLVRRLYQSDVCTSPTFVLVRRLYWSDVCASDVCTVRRLYCPTFVASDVCASDVCTGTVYPELGMGSEGFSPGLNRRTAMRMMRCSWRMRERRRFRYPGVRVQPCGLVGVVERPLTDLIERVPRIAFPDDLDLELDVPWEDRVF